MSLVERVDVLVAIILGLALAELGTSFHRLMRAGKRVRWDWMSPVLAGLMLLETVQFWWLSQSWYARATELRMIEFLPQMVILLLILLLTLAIMVCIIPAAVHSDYLGGVARRELLDSFLLVVAITALSVRNIRVQQGAVIVLFGIVSWVYVVSARAFH